MRIQPHLHQRSPDDLMYTYLHAGVRPSFLVDAPRYKESCTPGDYEFPQWEVDKALAVIRRLEGAQWSYLENGWSTKYKCPSKYSNSPDAQVRKDVSFAAAVLLYIHPNQLQKGLSIAQIISAYSFYTSLIHDANAEENAIENYAEVMPINSFIYLAQTFSAGTGRIYDCSKCTQRVYQYTDLIRRVAKHCPHCDTKLEHSKIVDLNQMSPN